MLLIRFFIFSILFLNIPDDITDDRAMFISPVNIPLSFSANFGELRSDHFHSGVDIKTQGVTGKEIIAAADGYIYRIAVSPGGFGKALYLRHPSGYSTVYGHLDRFTPDVERYVRQQQYNNKSFTVNLFPPKNRFSVKQGDLIAWSGNTGSSSGPHLHYEIRKSDSEKPINPLLFEFGASDDIEPVIERLAIYPINRSSRVNDENKPAIIKVAGGKGKYYIPASRTVKIYGPAGFGIQSFDRLNDSHNKCGIYSIELKIDSVSVYNYVMDIFSFNETKYINSHIDYETYLKENIRIQKTYVLPNDKLSLYSNKVNRGIFNFNEDREYKIEIIISDVHGNVSTLNFYVQGDQETQSDKNSYPVDKNKVYMDYTKSNTFRAEDIFVNVPAGCLYDTIGFTYKKEDCINGMFSEIHHIHNIYTPVHKPFSLSIKPDTIPEGLESKMLIVQLFNNKKIMGGLKTTFSDGYFTADSPTFGMFSISADTTAPSIVPVGFSSGHNFSRNSKMKIRINDDLSGIKSYEPLIDGQWTLFEYDQKNNLLICEFDPDRIPANCNHTLELRVTDNKDNQSIFKCDFKW